jgi:ABC-type bacteriocin/lantibiotic exporter with double-glycine peptidase domain
LTASLLVFALAAALEVPFVPQNDDTCAAAAMAMVLRYWGAPASHDEIADAVVTPDLHGALGSRLATFARRRGFTAIAYRGDQEHLREMTAKGRPLIVAWATGPGRFHNVVVVGVDRSGALLVNDPAVGAARPVSSAAFEKRWSGAGHWTLLVQPHDK